jgi:hypothetical protein
MTGDIIGDFNILRGNGYTDIVRVLDVLEFDPSKLDRARSRFNHSPPSYNSELSGTTTRSASPDPRSDEERLRYERRFQLMEERHTSYPAEQFEAQEKEEVRRILNADPRTRDRRNMPIAGPEWTEATETIRRRWIEQGIWRDRWDEAGNIRSQSYGLWKHEEPLDLGTCLGTDTEVESPERQAVREREREASRPYHQFIHQISKERKRIEDESALNDGVDAVDINTRAYDNVKNTWVNRRIWNERWRILPGMLWKHEEPLEEDVASVPACIPNLLVKSNHDATDSSNRQIRRSPSPTTSNRFQIFGIETSQRGPSSDVDSARSGIIDTETYFPASNLSPTMEQSLQSSRRQPSYRDGRPNSVKGLNLDPVQSLEVSKDTSKTKLRPWPQPNSLQRVPSSDFPSLFGPNIAEQQPLTTGIPRRRSKRLQQLESSLGKGPVGIRDSPKVAAPSRSKSNRTRKSKLKGSAKPQGVVKKSRSPKV